MQSNNYNSNNSFNKIRTKIRTAVSSEINKHLSVPCPICRAKIGERCHCNGTHVMRIINSKSSENGNTDSKQLSTDY